MKNTIKILHKLKTALISLLVIIAISVTSITSTSAATMPTTISFTDSMEIPSFSDVGIEEHQAELSARNTKKKAAVIIGMIIIGTGVIVLVKFGGKDGDDDEDK